MHFLETLDSLLNKLPKSELIIGADINANIGRFDNKYAADFGLAIGPHGFPNRNPKGEGLLNIYLAHRLRVMNTFFPGSMDQDMARGLALNLHQTGKLIHTCSTL